MDLEQDNQEQSMIDIIQSSELNGIYFNAFGIGVSKNDILILLKRNGKPEAVLNASHITAKALVNSLDQALKKFEDDTNQKIPTSDELEKLMEDEDDTN